MTSTILVVDDQAGIRFPIAHILREMGYRVLESGNGREAVEIAKAERPDLIVMDLAMPLMSGREAAHVIRSSPEIGETPIIAHSGEVVTVAERQKLLALFDSHLRKPTDPHQLVLEIGELLGDH